MWTWRSNSQMISSRDRVYFGNVTGCENGSMDLVVWSYATRGMQVAHSNGTGFDFPTWTSAQPAASPRILGVADVDVDGMPDLIRVRSTGEIDIWNNVIINRFN